MKKNIKTALLLSLLTLFCCNKNENDTNPQVDEIIEKINTEVNFQYTSTIQVGGEASAEISAFDKTTNKLFVVNSDANEVSVYNLTDVKNPTQLPSINLSEGAPNSIAAQDGQVAIAVENDNKQASGKVLLYNASDLTLEKTFGVGALPDMVTFTPDGNYILVANEGEPNDDYTDDPDGTVSIIDLEGGFVSNLNFNSFDIQEEALAEEGFRVFGPNASLSEDVEPEYIAVSDNSQTAWVALQENNGLAKINIVTKTIEAIYPLGFKDYSLSENEIDPSNKDDKKELRSIPVYGMYQPDAITYTNINGVGYIISANEGDSREYDAFVNEERIKDIDLDPTAFPDADNLQEDENLGRLKIALDLGDTDGDGDYDELYAYGGRSFSIWSEDGVLVKDSGNSISQVQLDNSLDTFNDDDGRSDDKGAEPEAVQVLNMGNERYILFVGLERTDQVLIYDITNPNSPEFLNILSNDGDEGPEGLLVIPASDSPSGKDLLIVSNEDSGTVSIYENNN